MKAMRIHEPGGPEVLRYEDVPDPVPGPGEVLIHVHAAGVNPADRQAITWQKTDRRYPWTPGYDVAGEILKPADDVSGYEPGTPVFGMLFPKPAGAYAQYVAAPVTQITAKPDTLEYEEAAALPIVALTAWQALFETGGLSSGQTVLIHAAAGGVGHIAVQLAKWKGARVIGIASGRNEQFLRTLGVDQFVDYNTTRFEDRVKEVDLVLEVFGGDTVERSLQVLKKGGTYVSIKRKHDPDLAARHGIHSKYVLARPDSSDLDQIAHLVDDGHVRPHIDKVFPLNQLAAAFEFNAAGHTRGKAVVSVS